MEARRSVKPLSSGPLSSILRGGTLIYGHGSMAEQESPKLLIRVRFFVSVHRLIGIMAITDLS